MSSSTSGKKGKSTRERKRKSKRRNQNEVVAPLVVQDDKRMTAKELLQGIDNNVTLDMITTKLPWNTLNILSSVSTAWHQAIQDHLVYDARVGSNSSWPLVIVNHTLANNTLDKNSWHFQYDRTNALALYCMRNGTFFTLPPIPQVDSGIPWRSRCVSLAGKVYVLGGLGRCLFKFSSPFSRVGSRKVYMFDVAGQKEWKICAPMLNEREEFGCGVLNGKIHVFGGSHSSEDNHISEVYDPDRDVWSTIKAIPCREYDHEVTPVGEELYVYGGKWLSTPKRPAGWLRAPELPKGVRAYNPIQNKWRVLIPSIKDMKRIDGYPILESGRLFVALGKVHYMSLHSIFVYDFNNNSWTKMHAHSFRASEHQYTLRSCSEYSFKKVERVYHVNNELLAIVSGMLSTSISPGFDDDIRHSLLFRSIGFNNTEAAILWEKVACPLSFQGLDPSSLLLSIQQL